MKTNSPLRRARQRRQWTLQEAADKLGCSISTLSLVERGMQEPTGILASRMASHYAVQFRTVYAWYAKAVAVRLQLLTKETRKRSAQR